MAQIFEPAGPRVRAVRWDGSDRALVQAKELLGDLFDGFDGEDIVFFTPDGRTTVYPGEWIVKSPYGCFEMPDVLFQARYVLAKENA